MSQRIVGYEGEGRHRRPLYADEGPSAAGGSYGGLPGVARLSGLTSHDLDDGAGRRVERVERREISQAEIDARRAAEARPSPIALRPRESRREVTSQSDDVGPALREDPAVSEAGQDLTTESPTEARDITLVVLADAVRDAAAAWDEVTASEHLLDQARVGWTRARAALDAAYRAIDDPPAALDSERPNIPETIPVAAPLASSVDASKASIPADSVKPTGGGPGPMPPFVRRILDALVDTKGDRPAAAAKLGIKPTSLVGSLGKIRKRTDLTDLERDVITSSRRR